MFMLMIVRGEHLPSSSLFITLTTSFRDVFALVFNQQDRGLRLEHEQLT